MSMTHAETETRIANAMAARYAANGDEVGAATAARALDGDHGALLAVASEFAELPEAAQDEAIWLAAPPSPPVDLVALFDELSAVMLRGRHA